MDKAMLYGKGSSDPLVTFTIIAQEPLESLESLESTDVNESTKRVKKALGAGARRKAAKAAAKRSKPIKVGERRKERERIEATGHTYLCFPTISLL